MKNWIAIGIIGIMAVAGSGGLILLNGSGEELSPAPTTAPHYEVIATVTGMIDGDTTYVRIDNIVAELDPDGGVYEGSVEKVRYGGGIDAPEMNWSSGNPDPGAVEATEFIDNLIPVETTVYLDLNALSHGGETGRPYRGRYERLIAIIYTEKDGQWINVNAELLRWGQEEYPYHDWLRYRYYPSEHNPDDWLAENYPYVSSS